MMKIFGYIIDILYNLHYIVFQNYKISKCIGVRPNRCALFEKMSFTSRQIPLHIFLCAKREEMCGGHLNKKCFDYLAGLTAIYNEKGVRNN